MQGCKLYYHSESRQGDLGNFNSYQGLGQQYIYIGFIVFLIDRLYVNLVIFGYGCFNTAHVIGFLWLAQIVSRSVRIIVILICWDYVSVLSIFIFVVIFLGLCPCYDLACWNCCWCWFLENNTLMNWLLPFKELKQTILGMH